MAASLRWPRITSHWPQFLVPSSPVVSSTNAKVFLDFCSLPVWDWISQVCRTCRRRCLVKTCLFLCWRQAHVDEYLISYVNELPIIARDIASATRERSSFGSRVRFHITRMAFSSCRSRVTAIFFTQAWLSVDQGYVLWGLRFVIPEAYNVRLLDDLHQKHHGICLWLEAIYGGPEWIRPPRAC